MLLSARTVLHPRCIIGLPLSLGDQLARSRSSGDEFLTESSKKQRDRAARSDEEKSFRASLSERFGLQQDSFTTSAASPRLLANLKSTAKPSALIVDRSTGRLILAGNCVRAERSKAGTLESSERTCNSLRTLDGSTTRSSTLTGTSTHPSLDCLRSWEVGTIVFSIARRPCSLHRLSLGQHGPTRSRSGQYPSDPSWSAS